MARLSLKATEERIKPLAGKDEYDREFIFDLMLAYGRSKGNITRLRNGSLNIADDLEHEVAQKNVIYFRETTGGLTEFHRAPVYKQAQRRICQDLRQRRAAE